MASRKGRSAAAFGDENLDETQLVMRSRVPNMSDPAYAGGRSKSMTATTSATLTPRRARIAKHTVALEGVTRLLNEVISEREWAVQEQETVFFQKATASSELREVERQMAELERKKAELEYHIGRLTAREDDLKEDVAYLDGKIAVMSQESAGFEKRIRGIKGTDTGLATDGTAMQRHRATSDSCIKPLYGHSAAVMGVDFDFSYGTLVTASADKTVRVWDLTSKECTQVLSGHAGWVRSVSLHPTSRFVASGSGDMSVRMWDLVGGKSVHTLLGHKAGVSAVAIDDTYLVSGSVDRTLRSWDQTTGQATLVLNGHTSHVTDLQFWKYALLSASADGTIRMWDMRTGNYHRNIRSNQGSVNCIQFNEGSIVSGGSDGTVKIWDLRTGECQRTIETGFAVNDVQFDEDRLICATTDADILSYSMKDPSVEKKIGRHQRGVRSIKFSGDFMVSGSMDSTAKLWNL